MNDCKVRFLNDSVNWVRDSESEDSCPLPSLEGAFTHARNP